SASDEPVLEQGLHDARKEVRETALRLLRRLPESSFARRWTERAQTVVQFRDTVLQVSPPANVPDAWIADGLDPQPPKGLGAMTWLVQQTVSFADPSIWRPDAPRLVADTDWERPLLAGLGQAAATYGHHEWCERLLIAWAGALERGDTLPLNAPALFAALD